MWSVSRKTAGSARRLVGPDAFEDAGAVVQPVRADVNRGVGPVHELAVHPDLLGLSIRRPPSSTGTGPARRRPSDVRAEAQQLERGQRRPCAARSPRPTQTALGQERSLDEDRVDVRRAGTARPLPARSRWPRAPRRARRPRVPGARRRRRSSRGRRAGRRARARAPGRPSQTKTSDFTIWPSVAADRRGGGRRGRCAVGELLDPRLGALRATTRRRARPASGQSCTARA